MVTKTRSPRFHMAPMGNPARQSPLLPRDCLSDWTSFQIANIFQRRKFMLYLIALWSLTAIILHFADVGAFRKWPVISWPWKWSCLCLLEWCLGILLALVALVAMLALMM